MKLAFNTGLYQKAGYSIEYALDRLKYNGFDVIDFVCYGDFKPQSRPVSEQLRIEKKLQQLDLQAHTAIYLPRCNNPGAASKEERLACVEEMKPTGEFIKRIGGRFLMFCEATGRPDYATNVDKRQAFDNSIDTIKRVCEWADKIGIHVFLELIPYGGNLDSCEAMKEALDRVKAPNLWANIDLGHCGLQKINGKRFSLLGDKLINLHISDNDNTGDEGWIMEDDAIIGEGNADLKGYFEEISKLDLDANARKSGIKGLDECVVTIECSDLAGCPNPDYSVVRCRDYVLTHLPYFSDPKPRS